jgi:hypothetical protein
MWLCAAQGTWRHAGKRLSSVRDFFDEEAEVDDDAMVRCCCCCCYSCVQLWSASACVCVSCHC